jgi:BsuBI/PstI restriction endonuclease domain/BsuBI/PstI restriction endonuclease HTH domain
MNWRPLPTIEQVEERLEMLFPKAAFDTVMSNPIAAWSLAVMLYVDAVVPVEGDLPEDATWVRPATVLWLPTEAYRRDDPALRGAYRENAAAGNAKRRVVTLMADWGIQFEQPYADNSREQVRDETWPRWVDERAMRIKPGVKTTSSAGRWALTDAFADLFDPALSGDVLIERIEAFRDTHMNPGSRLQALMAWQRSDQTHGVDVTLPNATTRHLEPGETSVILKGVIEMWAPKRLKDPVVLTISEPGDKMYTADTATIQRLGLAIDQTTLLPDALLVDVAVNPPVFWVIEAVATDGPIDEDRKRALLKWATEQRIPADACQFLTAFGSRNAAAAKRRLKDLAAGTYAWYADEPDRELAWYELNGP